MKRTIIFLIFFLLAVPSALAWQDSVIPPENIKESTVLYKVVPDKNNIIYVSQDIPAGLYGISAGRFDNSPILHTDYMFGIMRGTETVFQSSLINTETSSELIIHLRDGDVLLIVTSLDDIVYLYSVDTFMLRPY